jgi:hypothetical protein
MLAAGIARFDLISYMYVVLMFLYALIFSSIFAVFLPRLINETTGETAIQKMKVLGSYLLPENLYSSGSIDWREYLLDGID